MIAPPDTFGKLIANDIAKWAKVAKQAGIKAVLVSDTMAVPDNMRILNTSYMYLPPRQRMRSPVT